MLMAFSSHHSGWGKKRMELKNKCIMWMEIYLWKEMLLHGFISEEDMSSSHMASCRTCA